MFDKEEENKRDELIRKKLDRRKINKKYSENISCLIEEKENK